MEEREQREKHFSIGQPRSSGHSGRIEVAKSAQFNRHHTVYSGRKVLVVYGWIKTWDKGVKHMQWFYNSIIIITSKRIKEERVQRENVEMSKRENSARVQSHVVIILLCCTFHSFGGELVNIVFVGLSLLRPPFLRFYLQRFVWLNRCCVNSLITKRKPEMLIIAYYSGINRARLYKSQPSTIKIKFCLILKVW